MSNPDHLRKVERAATKAAAAHAALVQAIQEAHLSGESLRSIAAAAGVSHEQVRRLLSK